MHYHCQQFNIAQAIYLTPTKTNFKQKEKTYLLNQSQISYQNFKYLQPYKQIKFLKNKKLIFIEAKPPQQAGEELPLTTAARGANLIGDNRQNLGELGHKLSHATLGCVGAKASGKDCESGAIGAVAVEVIAEQVSTNPELNDKEITGISRIGTAAITQGLDKDVEVGDKAAINVVENNTLYALNNRIIATDGIDNKKLVELTEEALALGLTKEEIVFLSNIQQEIKTGNIVLTKKDIIKIKERDLSEFDNVYDLNNP